MINILYTFATIVALVIFAFRILEGNTIWSSFLRSSLTFLAILFTFFIAGLLLKAGLAMTELKPQAENETEQES